MTVCHISMEIGVSAVIVCDRVGCVAGSMVDSMAFICGIPAAQESWF